MTSRTDMRVARGRCCHCATSPHVACKVSSMISRVWWINTCWDMSLENQELTPYLMIQFITMFCVCMCVCVFKSNNPQIFYLRLIGYQVLSSWPEFMLLALISILRTASYSHLSFSDDKLEKKTGEECLLIVSATGWGPTVLDTSIYFELPLQSLEETQPPQEKDNF